MASSDDNFNVSNWIKDLAKKIVSIPRNITVEPIFICWFLPAILLSTAMENLELQKACLVNLGFESSVCTNMLNRSINDIDCNQFKEELAKYNLTYLTLNITSDIDLVNFDETVPDNETSTSTSTSTSGTSPVSETTEVSLNNTTEFAALVGDEMTVPDDAVLKGEELWIMKVQVCKAESESQRLNAILVGYRSPIIGIFPIIIILFAGGWSDRKGLRKPCMLFPLIGESLGCIALLISAIFMKELPLEFGGILGNILPAMTGGMSVMLMGMLSYLSACTNEENRVFRFGILTMLVTIMIIVFYPFAGVLFNALGFVYLFILCLCIYAIGFLYYFFILKEIKKPEKVIIQSTSVNGVDNPAFDAIDHVGNKNLDVVKAEVAKAIGADKHLNAKKSNFLKEFFDPTVVLDCIKVCFKVRKNNGRTILIMMILAYLAFVAPALGKGEFIYDFARKNMNWNIVDYSNYVSATTFANLIGTFVMISLFSSICKMSDPMVGIIAVLGGVISRPFAAWATTGKLFYTSAIIDLFFPTLSVALKSIIGRYVENDELGKVFSILGIMDAIDGFVFPTVYSLIYLHTLDSFPGAIFLVDEIFFIPTLLLFIVLYFKLRRKPVQNETEIGVDNNGMIDVDLGVTGREVYRSNESTYM